MLRKFVFYSAGVQLHSMVVDESVGQAAVRLCAALSSNPTIVDVTAIKNVLPGTTYDAGTFYDPDGTALPAQEDIATGTMKYAVVVDGTVKSTIEGSLEYMTAKEYQSLRDALAAPGVTIVDASDPSEFGHYRPYEYGGCLVGSTLVRKAEGFVEAQRLQVGDLVITADVSELSALETAYTIGTWNSETFTVQRLYATEVVRLKTMKVVSQYVEVNEVDKYSLAQLVLVSRGGEHRFIPAERLVAGDRLLSVGADETVTPESLRWTDVTSVQVKNAHSVVYLFATRDGEVLFTKLGLVHNLKL